jgi:hypothetical protein
MRRALLVDDIVHVVLQNVTSSAMNMINFASTCSAVSSPALNILWRIQSSLEPLIMCLPQDTWEIRGDNVVVSYVHYRVGHWLTFCSTLLANRYPRNGSVSDCMLPGYGSLLQNSVIPVPTARRKCIAVSCSHFLPCFYRLRSSPI